MVSTSANLGSIEARAVADRHRASLLNLPNKLTTARLGLAFVLFVTIWMHQWLASFGIFAVAALTDWLDGYFARKRDLVSSLGRVYDPLVDKVLTCGAFVFLMEVPAANLNAWMVTIIIAREFIVTGLRGFLEDRGVSFGADWLGKSKMVLQCAAIMWLLVFLSYLEPAISTEPRLADAAALSMKQGVPQSLFWVRDILNWTVVLITFASGANYVRKAIKHLT